MPCGGIMSGEMDEDFLLTSRGQQVQLGAYAIGVAFSQSHVAFAGADGCVHVLSLSDPAEKNQIRTHEDGLLSFCASPAADGFLSGGDDGQLRLIRSDGTVETLAGFKGKWVETIAVHPDRKLGVIACTAGRAVHVFNAQGKLLKTLEHASTVTGLAFDAKGKRLFASHYNGVSIWYVASKTDNPRVLAWKGSHTGVAVHPAAEAVVTSMQENSLHGWRLSDGHHMRMSGYPAKTRSLSFSRSGKWLASSGAEAIVLWPFFGGGPMGKQPMELAPIPDGLCTAVACHPRHEAVAAGYSDGLAVMADIESGRILPICAPGRGEITVLRWSPDGRHLAFGTETGFAAWIDFSRQD
ncbi:putative WD40 repeat protein [Granulibacter bethesdensis]|uniref:WD40 repeat protein n=2 Tax=Granulibacter bethesdensis TaxID=364410 RepID=A0AAN0RBQ9_9PROT|nr:putative WD40 repeat protein [Granulibacter bethesdensis]AHJ64542.1 putative WD40 repeat protein [Granulibacter bethesdensis CGDNIH4]